MATQLGEIIHVLDDKEFEVGQIIKLGPSRYAEIISKDEFLKEHPCNQHQDRCLPIKTMDGEKKLVHIGQVLIVNDPKTEYDKLKQDSHDALSFLKKGKAN